MARLELDKFRSENDAKNKSIAINYLDGSEEKDIDFKLGIKSINKKLKKPVFKI